MKSKIQTLPSVEAAGIARQESHAFSIELNHRGKLKTVAIPSNANGTVVIEGFLGELVSVSFVEEAMLELRGVNGAFRIDLEPGEIAKLQRLTRVEVKQ